ncbi:MAG: BNR-4 repeat-containing protein [Phycisphaerae bacterium]
MTTGAERPIASDRCRPWATSTAATSTTSRGPTIASSSTARSDGPYVIVNGATGQPAEVGGTGNVYCKGDLVLGKESSGPHSLHLVWNTRILWDDTLGAQHQWNYNLYYARSDDGGNTWHNIDNTASVALTTHIAWNDARFLAFSGDVDQNSERAFDVDNNGRPFMVVLRYRAGTGTLYGAHVDTSAATVPSYDLTFQYWNGSSWTRGVIDSQVNWTQSRPKARVDADGNFYVFVGESPRYYRSTDGGQTWAAPVIFGNQAGSGWRLYSAPDPLDENYHNVMYQNRATHRLYYTRLQLTNR